jgi:hypothetical protein
MADKYRMTPQGSEFIVNENAGGTVGVYKTKQEAQRGMEDCQRDEFWPLLGGSYYFLTRLAFDDIVSGPFSGHFANKTINTGLSFLSDIRSICRPCWRWQEIGRWLRRLAAHASNGPAGSLAEFAERVLEVKTPLSYDSCSASPS